MLVDSRTLKEGGIITQKQLNDIRHQEPISPLLQSLRRGRRNRGRGERRGTGAVKGGEKR